LNTVDIARYLFARTAIQNATQMAAQTAWQTCGTALLPATTSCPGLTAALTAAVHSSSLGTRVALAAGSPTEAYYCVNSAGALVSVSAISSKPADCSSVGNAAGQPGDYIKIQASYAYKPLFSGISVAGRFTTPIAVTSIMRLQ
jgi:hypothetical protein